MVRRDCIFGSFLMFCHVKVVRILQIRGRRKYFDKVGFGPDSQNRVKTHKCSVQRINGISRGFMQYFKSI